MTYPLHETDLEFAVRQQEEAIEQVAHLAVLVSMCAASGRDQSAGRLKLRKSKQELVELHTHLDYLRRLSKRE